MDDHWDPPTPAGYDERGDLIRRAVFGADGEPVGARVGARGGPRVLGAPGGPRVLGAADGAYDCFEPLNCTESGVSAAAPYAVTIIPRPSPVCG